jgi:hypothetical protein
MAGQSAGRSRSSRRFPPTSTYSVSLGVTSSSPRTSAPRPPVALLGLALSSGVYEATCEFDQLSGRFAGLVDTGLRDEFRRVGSFVATLAGGIEPLQ